MTSSSWAPAWPVSARRDEKLFLEITATGPFAAETQVIGVRAAEEVIGALTPRDGNRP